MRDVYLHIVQPKNEEQKKLKELLTQLKMKEYILLLLCGDTGLGKTYMSQALANTIIYNAVDPEYSALYTTHFEMERKLRASMNGKGLSELDLIQKYKNYRLLIIDELGRGTISEYMMNTLEYIISERLARERRTILITNKSPEELRTIFDRQMQDRLGILEGGETNPQARSLMMQGKSLRSST